MAEMAPYLYGDEIAEIQGQIPVGMPYAAGYAYGYHLIQAYLKNTGKSIIEATVTPTEEILEVTKDFWQWHIFAWKSVWIWYNVGNFWRWLYAL